MKAKEIITETDSERQKLDEFFPLALAALAGTTAGATLGDYILQKRKGAKDWNFGQSVGRNIERGERFIKKDVAPAAGKLAKDIYKGYTGKDAPENLEQFIDQLPIEPEPSPEEKEKETFVGGRRDDPVEKLQQWQKEYYGSQLGTDKDEVKEQAKQKSSFEIEVEKNFSDPYVRKAIMAKARQESGGKNIGEQDWTGTSNVKLKKIFPQLKNLDNSQLDSLKSKGNQAFLDYAYKDIGGYKYRGRGPIQITGKSNYARLDKDLGLNGELIKNPDLLLKDPNLANAASIQYLKNAGLHTKKFDNQISAHQSVIYAIGGKYYAPGTLRGEQALAQIQSYDADKGQSAKPSTTATPTKKTTTTTSTTSTKPGESYADVLKRLDVDLAAKRAAAQRPPDITTEPVKQPSKPETKPETKPEEKSKDALPTDIEPKAKDLIKKIEPDDVKLDTQQYSTWNKIIDKITHGNISPAELNKIVVPESVNIQNELTDILVLAGFKK